MTFTIIILHIYTYIYIYIFEYIFYQHGRDSIRTVMFILCTIYIYMYLKNIKVYGTVWNLDGSIGPIGPLVIFVEFIKRVPNR